MSFRHYEYLVIKHGIYFLTVRPILGSPITRSLELSMEAIIAAIAGLESATSAAIPKASVSMSKAPSPNTCVYQRPTPSKFPTPSAMMKQLFLTPMAMLSIRLSPST